MESDISEYVEVDPTGRYGRYNEILGKGSSKTVYRAFDEYEGIEVAWNQVKLTDFLQSSEDLERLYKEIHLLRTLNHSNIMKFYASWIDIPNRNINFVTEMFTSGTLRQYRLKHKRVNIRAVKHWCRQILKGLVYLHSLDPPVIHRDLKCDNIFINGNHGQVKIGDLGLAAILRKSHAARCGGTPEFMAPEVYKEEYNELVDIYSFGMCVLEMVTFEYPYSECNHPAQIYKKVISGTKPDALYKVKDPELRQFVEKCLATVSYRLPASELLRDPFLQTDSYGYDLRPIDYHRDCNEMESVAQAPFGDRQPCYGSLATSFSDYGCYELDHDLDYETEEFGISEIDHFFMSPDYDHLADLDIAIKGKKSGDGNIFFRLRTVDKEGRVKNIYFPFDTENDTALTVATEMVAELVINKQDATKIADMIDGEIASLVPDWNKGVSIEEEEEGSTQYLYLSSDNPTSHNLHVLHCSGHASSTHGRFEEVTYQVDATEQSVSELSEGAPAAALPIQLDENDFNVILAQHDESSRSFKQLSLHTDEEIRGEDENGNPSKPNARVADHENLIQKELRWLKAKYERQLRELGVNSGWFQKGPRDGRTQDRGMDKFGNCAPSRSYFGPGSLLVRTGKNFDKEALLPHSLNRATSLPVDAVDW